MSLTLHVFKLGAACISNAGPLPTLYDNISCDGNGVPQITSFDKILVIVGNVARILIALSVGLAIIAIIAGAIYYVVSAGDPGRIKTAKDILTNAIVGLVLILGAYAVVTFIAKGF